MAVTKDAVLDELKRVKGPDRVDDIVALGLVSEIVVQSGRVYFAISVDPSRAQELEPMRQVAEKVVLEIPGVEKVMVTPTAENGGRQGAPGAGKAHACH